MIQTGSPNDSLSAAQRNLLYWHRRLAHMDFEKIKDFSRKGFLTKDLATCKTHICPYCMQAKQVRNSISGSATGGHIESSNLKGSILTA